MIKNPWTLEVQYKGVWTPMGKLFKIGVYSWKTKAQAMDAMKICRATLIKNAPLRVVDIRK